jgi:methionine biosynthesis protein MetW
MRVDLAIIKNWISDGSRVLDLGCGDGALLKTLIDDKHVQGYGLEIDPLNIQTCVENGVNVVEQDLDQGLGNFATNSFDTVVMTQTLQAVHYPHLVLDEMLRVGKQGIITFPNFGHWRCRVYLTTVGKMPVSKFMPYTWYDTPNIHFCTVKDFETLCRQKNIHILNKLVVDQQNNSNFLAGLWPNLFGVTAIYHVSK